MRAKQSRKLDRLLSGDPGPSVQEKETVLQAVLERSTEAPAGPGRALNLRLVTGLAAVACGLLVFGALWLWAPDRIPVGQETGFATRGQADVKSAFEPLCRPVNAPKQVSSACRPGDLLAFRLSPPEGAAYFSAAALRADGLLIWYFPSASTSSSPTRDQGLAERGVMLGADHEPGPYRLFGAYSAKPLSQERFRAAIEAHAAGQATGLDFAERKLQLDPL